MGENGGGTMINDYHKRFETREDAVRSIMREDRLRAFAEYIHPAYVALNWEWGGMNLGVPSEDDIFATLVRLTRYNEEGSSTVSTGGLETSVEEVDDGWRIHIKFEANAYDVE